MTNKNVLGILVNTNKHFDFVLMLAEAAFAKKLTVSIHLRENGLDLILAATFARLSQLAQITICDLSMRKRSAEFVRQIPDSVISLPPGHLAEMFNTWERHVVF